MRLEGGRADGLAAVVQAGLAVAVLLWGFADSAGASADSAGASADWPEPVVAVSSTESSVELEISARITGSRGRVGSDPFAGCVVGGPSTAEAVVSAYGPGTVSRGGGPDSRYSFVVCERSRFDGFAAVVWPIDDGPPPVIVNALVLAARNALEVPVPAPRASPDGASVPFLTQLPVWLWLDETVWAPVSASASLGGLGASITATAVPESTLWTVGDVASTRCGRGKEWTTDLGDAPAACSVTLVDTAASLPLRVEVGYALEFRCLPVLLCVGLDVPVGLRVSAAREVRVVEVRGVLTG